MISIQTARNGVGLAFKFFRITWKTTLPVVTLLLALWIISVYIVPSRSHPYGYAKLPLWANALSLTISVIQYFVTLLLLVRACTWLHNERLSFVGTLTKTLNLLGPGVITLISGGLFYFAIPMVLLLISLFIWPSWTLQTGLFATVLFPITAFMIFGSIFSIPVLIMENLKGFRNVTRAIKISIKEFKFTLIIVTPWVLFSAFRIVADWMKWKSDLFGLAGSVISFLMIVINLFIYFILYYYEPRQKNEV
jgi:hypothetical protein